MFLDMGRQMGGTTKSRKDDDYTCTTSDLFYKMKAKQWPLVKISTILYLKKKF